MPHLKSQPRETPPTESERAWAEYLHWTRGADPAQYELTETLAWERLQLALLGDIPNGRSNACSPS